MTDAARQSWVDDYLGESAEAIRTLAADSGLRETMARMADRIAASLRAGGKLLVAGNGGSAADAQHIAGEFLSRLMFDRAPLPAMALTTDSSVLTAIGNDYGFDHIFARQVRGLGRKGDVLLAISTSGRSANVLAALDAARAQGLVTLAFCGADAAGMALADLVLCAPSSRTAIIQQVHITAAHVICATVERHLFAEAEPAKFSLGQ